MVNLDSKGLTKQAFVEAKTSLFFNPDSNAAIYAGNYANLNKDYDTAAYFYKNVLKHNDEINFHIALAEVYYKDGFHKDCLNEYAKALLLNPSSIPVRLRMAELYAKKGMIKEAEAECEFIVMSSPTDEKIKAKVKDVLSVVFDKKFLAPYYDKVQIDK